MRDSRLQIQDSKRASCSADRPDVSGSALLAFLVDAMSFWQHALMEEARYQDASGRDPIENHMPGMFHAAQAGPDMVADTA